MYANIDRQARPEVVSVPPRLSSSPALVHVSTNAAPATHKVCFANLAECKHQFDADSSSQMPPELALATVRSSTTDQLVWLSALEMDTLSDQLAVAMAA